MRKKLLAMLLAAVMLLGLLPVLALADGEAGGNEITSPYIRVYKDSVDGNYVCGGEGKGNQAYYTPGTAQTYIIKLLQDFWYIVDGTLTVDPENCGVDVTKDNALTATITVSAETNCNFAVSYQFCIGQNENNENIYGNGQITFTNSEQGGGDQGGGNNGSQTPELFTIPEDGTPTTHTQFTYEDTTYYVGVGRLKEMGGDIWALDAYCGGLAEIPASEAIFGMPLSVGFYTKSGDTYQEVDQELAVTLFGAAASAAENSTTAPLSFRICATRNSQTVSPMIASDTPWAEKGYPHARPVVFNRNTIGPWAVILSGTLPNGTVLSDTWVGNVEIVALEKTTVEVNSIDDLHANLAELEKDTEKNVEGNEYIYILPTGELTGDITVPAGINATVTICGNGFDNAEGPMWFLSQEDSTTKTTLNGSIKALNRWTNVRGIAFEGAGKDSPTTSDGRVNYAITGNVYAPSYCAFTGYYYAIYADADSYAITCCQCAFTGNHYGLYLDSREQGDSSGNVEFSRFTGNDCAVCVKRFDPIVRYSLFENNTLDAECTGSAGSLFAFGNRFVHESPSANAQSSGAEAGENVFTSPYYTAYNGDEGWINFEQFVGLTYARQHSYDNGADWFGMQFIPKAQLDGMEITLWDTSGDADAVIGTITFNEEGETE